jgi:hypothetical protein
LAPAVVASDFFHHPKPGLLKKVIGEGGILSQPHEKSIQAMLVLRHDRAQRVQIALSETGNRVFHCA